MRLDLQSKICHRGTVTLLDPPDNHHLNAAIGWIGLGNYADANEELEKIAPVFRAHPDVLEVRCQIYAHAKKWSECVDITEAIIKLDANRADAWINRSFALHEMGQTDGAHDQLLPVGDKFPGVWTIPYNLACYCAQLGKLDESREWFKKAIAIDEHTVRRTAIDDPDLIPLWSSMSGTVWKRSE